MAAVGTVVHTQAAVAGQAAKHTIVWTSDASGNVSGNAFGVGAGWVLAVKFIPSTGGTVPTTLYDITVVDTDGVDVVRGAGANLSATVPSISAAPEIAFHMGGNLDVVVANAGNAKSGTVVLIVGRRP